VRRAWAWTGALTVLLFAAGLLFGDLLGTDNFPPLDATGAELREYFTENDIEVRALSFFHTLSAVALLAFSAYIATLLDSRLALAGGVTAAAFLLLSAVCYRVLAEPETANDAALAHAMLVASYLAGGPAISVPLALLIAATIRRAGLPRGVDLLGVVTAAVCLLAALGMLGPANNTSAIYGILLLAAVLGFAWLVLASLFLARRQE
jgi:hypothetical protein